MDAQTFNWLISICVAATAVYFVTAIAGALGRTSSEFRRSQVEAGDDTLAELYINLSPEIFFLLRALSFAVMFLLGSFAAGIIFGLLLGVAGFVVPGLLLRSAKAKRVKKIELQLIEGLELLSSSLKSGLTLPQATELLVKEFPPPLSQEFGLVLNETRLGVDFLDALENMAKRLESSIIYILSTGVSITKRCGGDMSIIFGNIAQTIRERATIEGKLEAVTAQGRFQGLILGMMPFLLVIVLYFVDRQHVLTLFGYKLGIYAFAAVCIMVILAQLWIRKLMQIDV